MLVHAPRRHQSTPAAESPATAAAGLPLYDGSPTGMAASTIHLSPLSVQQNVPNIGDTQTAPKTKVNPTLEQGMGRAPGWRWGWMRKNIPFAPSTQAHAQPHYGAQRAMPARNAGAHAPGRGPGQLPELHNHKRHPLVLAGPETVVYTAAMPPTPTWGEPL